jgi:glycosyltransferase involved in cell wall biosynthesis
MKVTLLVPVLNVEPQLPQTLQGLTPIREDHDIEVLIVVDVPDPARAREVRERIDAVAAALEASAIYRVGERGFGSALRHGFARASGDVVIPLMADASDEPRDIVRLVDTLTEGWDIVAGSRYMPGGLIIGNTGKQRLSRLYGALVRLLGNLPVRDVSNSFKAYRREVLDAVDSQAESYDISAELTVKAHQAGYRITEIPTVWTNRQAGESNWRFLPELRRYVRWLALAASRRRTSVPGDKDPRTQEGGDP